MATKTVEQPPAPRSTALAPTAGGGGLTVQISPVVEREFKRRAVFPELRLGAAMRVFNGATGLYNLTADRARELLADAEAMGAQYKQLSRGVPAAYTALVRNLARTLQEEERRGLWADPGPQEALRRALESPACFEVGAEVLYFPENAEYGREGTIVKGYQMHAVTHKDGEYVDDDGDRVSYRFGYVMQLKDSDLPCFVAAHQVTRDDCKPAHLCLVACAPGSEAQLSRDA